MDPEEIPRKVEAQNRTFPGQYITTYELKEND